MTKNIPDKYEAIKVNSSIQSEYDFIEHPNYKNAQNELVGLSHVNIFIGQNNTGKSRLLRHLYLTDELLYRPFFEPSFYKELKAFKKNILEVVNKCGFQEFIFQWQGQQLLKKNAKELFPDIDEFNPEGTDMSAGLTDVKNLSEVIQKADHVRYNSATGGSIPHDQVLSRMQQVVRDHHSLFSQIGSLHFGEGVRDKFYIPILRNLNSFDFVNGSEGSLTDIFKERVIKNYSLKEDDGKRIFTGSQLYNDLQKMLLGEREERDKIRDFENFLGEHLFERKEINLVPRMNDKKVVYIGIEGDNEREVYNHGDGIQTILLLTYPMFESKAATYFIEEPEQHLHPKMQRFLLHVMGEMKQHQFFISTHSNSFLDYSFENKSIYKVESGGNKKKVSLCLDLDEKYSVLDDLGIRASEILQTNGVIWVEGPSDRIYIKKWLELLGENFLEGLHYTFQYYGGRLLSHYTLSDFEFKDFLNILIVNRNSFVVIDSDIKSTGGDINETKKRICKECDDQGMSYWVTEGREIENYLTNRVLSELSGSKVTRTKYGDIENYCDVFDSNRKVVFAKKVIEKMSSEDIEDNLFDLKEKMESLIRSIKTWNEL